MVNKYLDKYETTVRDSLRTYLKAENAINEMAADAPDLEGKWESIGTDYLTDGVREFTKYPTVSLGWMMFVGMAIAQMWDQDWNKYSKRNDLYQSLRDPRGYDNMDEYINEEVLLLNPDEARQNTRIVGDCATIAYRTLMHEKFEPSTPIAFHAYTRTLHQLYVAGIEVQLKRMGYKMTKLQ